MNVSKPVITFEEWHYNQQIQKAYLAKEEKEIKKENEKSRAKKNHVKPSTTSSPIAKNDGDDYAVPLSALEDTPRSTDLHATAAATATDAATATVITSTTMNNNDDHVPYVSNFVEAQAPHVDGLKRHHNIKKPRKKGKGSSIDELANFYDADDVNLAHIEEEVKKEEDREQRRIKADEHKNARMKALGFKEEDQVDAKKNDTEIPHNTILHGQKRIYSDGSVYVGDLIYPSMKREGNGTLLYKDKKGYYRGEWEQDVFHGNGKLKYKDGSFYKGSFFHGLRQGNDNNTKFIPIGIELPLSCQILYFEYKFSSLT